MQDGLESDLASLKNMSFQDFEEKLSGEINNTPYAKEKILEAKVKCVLDRRAESGYNSDQFALTSENALEYVELLKKKTDLEKLLKKPHKRYRLFGKKKEAVQDYNKQEDLERTISKMGALLNQNTDHQQGTTKVSHAIDRYSTLRNQTSVSLHTGNAKEKNTANFMADDEQMKEKRTLLPLASSEYSPLKSSASDDSFAPSMVGENTSQKDEQDPWDEIDKLKQGDDVEREVKGLWGDIEPEIYSRKKRMLRYISGRGKT